MNEAETIKFEGQDYFDDRLFVLYLCAGKVDIEEGENGAVWTSIYHENPPENHIWCVVTYRNCHRYPLYRVDSFYKKEDAEAYIKLVEPETPLVSLGGKSPQHPLSFEAYSKWKINYDLKEYNWKSLYSKDGTNAQERIGQTKDQFKGIK